MSARVFVIGLDGATFDLIKPWIAQGKLPNLARLLREGVHGELRSTIHPLTAPAWASFMTGKNPGKHGIFDFIMRRPGSYGVRLVDSTTRDARSLWSVLSHHGKHVVVINIPVNYPPEKVNGELISWMDAPGVDREFTHPPSLYQELRERVGEYVITVNFSARLDAHIEDIHRMIDNRAAVTEYLMETRPWDFFIVLFTAPDLVQHAFWKYMDPVHPRYTEAEARKYGDVIVRVYEKLDGRIARLLEKLEADATVFVVSDHGAGPLRKVVNLNRWLEEQGWLTFAESERAGGHRALVRGGRALVRLVRTRFPVRVKGRIRRLFPGLGSRVESALFTATIDWMRTRAFAVGAYGNIWINVRGREPAGIVEPGREYEDLRREIRARLLTLRDPDTGGPVVEEVHRREDLYHGPYVERAPDLVVQWKNYEYYSRQRFGEREETVFQTHLTRPLTTIEMNGYHRLNGIFIARGTHIRPGEEITGATIVDVAPTILAVLAVPVPDDMDGRVLTQIFRPEFLAAHPILREAARPKAPVRSGDDVYTAEDEERVAERLRGLGYLD